MWKGNLRTEDSLNFLQVLPKAVDCILETVIRRGEERRSCVGTVSSRKNCFLTTSLHHVTSLYCRVSLTTLLHHPIVGTLPWKMHWSSSSANRDVWRNIFEPSSCNAWHRAAAPGGDRSKRRKVPEAAKTAKTTTDTKTKNEKRCFATTCFSKIKIEGLENISRFFLRWLTDLVLLSAAFSFQVPGRLWPAGASESRRSAWRVHGLNFGLRSSDRTEIFDREKMPRLFKWVKSLRSRRTWNFFEWKKNVSEKSVKLRWFFWILC